MADEISKVELMKCICPADSGCSNRCDRGQIPPLPAATYRVKDGRLESATTPAAINPQPVEGDAGGETSEAERITHYEKMAAAAGVQFWNLPAAWLHDVAQDDGEQDQALSFSRHSFPLEGVGGFRSVKARPLFLVAPTPAEIMLAYENMTEDRATLARQLAEAERQNKIMRDADYHAAGVAQEQEIIELKSQLAEAIRRVARAEADARRWRTMMACDELRSGNGTLLFKRQAGVETYERAIDRFQSA